jgi:hypothetical protein
MQHILLSMTTSLAVDAPEIFQAAEKQQHNCN